MRDRLMVGHRPLKPRIIVRIYVPQPLINLVLSNMPVHSREVPLYDEKIASEFEEEGLSPNDAALVSATTMDGATEEVDGDINSTQTLCDALQYDETIPPSEGAKQGRKVTEDELKGFLNLPSQANSNDLNTAVDEWIRRKELEKGVKN